ncbi:MAG: DUF2760 domain-containing protein [Lentisphaeria bacterium]
MHLLKAIKAFWEVLVAKEQVKEPQSEVTIEMDDFTAGAIFTLNIMQREGRLVDFLMEDLESYTDAQVGVAARQIHRQSSLALRKYFDPGAVVVGVEGKEICLSAQVNLNSIKITGNSAVAGECRGILRHKGWRSEPNLPIRVGNLDSNLIFPAEIGS